MNKAVSVTAVLCNYNGEQYLEEAIDSVLAQECLPDEFVIVDDSSTDKSVEIICQAKSKAPELINFIRHEENKGQAAGMNTAFEASDGEILAFLDSDDVWFTDKIARVCDAYMTEPDFGLYQHNLQIIRDGDLTEEMYMPALAQGDLFELWNRYNTFPNFSPTSGLVVRREVFAKLAPLPEGLRISSDSFMTRSAICFGPVFSDLKPFGGYRKHSFNNVYGNTEHDSWEYFLNKVAPLLADFYHSHGFSLPEVVRCCDHKRTILDAFLDFNLRAIINKVKTARR